jgi:putative ABC transport system permease protein
VLFGEIFLVALEAIRQNKMRTILTTLGIVIGIAAVITMQALGSGAQKTVQEQISKLGTNLLTVFPGQSFQFGVASATRVSLTLDDYEALAAAGGPISRVIPEVSRPVQVQYESQNINVNVVGTTPEYVEGHDYAVPTGDMFTASDDAARRRVAVLGSAVPNLLGGNGPAMIGQQLMIGGSSFEIIGLLGEKGATMGPFNPDEQILIPLHTARYRLFGTDRLRSITVQVASPDSVHSAMITIEQAIRQQHHLRSDQDDDFQILDPAQFTAIFEATTRTFGFLLGGIAALSLLVGGIGIMNIMLVSVTERTREIGIRLALGATRQNILLQFLVEAIVLCLLGGAIGILVGAGGAFTLSKIANWNTMISPLAVVLAVAFSAAVGITFGLWPARRASKMDPVVALRYE